MDLSDLVFADRGSRQDEEQWFRENGPDAPGLIDYLRQHGGEFDRVLFWAYRYATRTSACRWSRTAPCSCRRRRRIR